MKRFPSLFGQEKPRAVKTIRLKFSVFFWGVVINLLMNNKGPVSFENSISS